MYAVQTGHILGGGGLEECSAHSDTFGAMCPLPQCTAIGLKVVKTHSLTNYSHSHMTNVYQTVEASF